MPILYLHGFRSTPLSTKAQMVADRMTLLGLSAQYVCPQLPASPMQAAALIERLAVQLTAQFPEQPLTLIGSSLGGFYATWLAERIDCRCVLLNPAVHPERDLVKYIGVQTVYGSDETIEIKAEFMHELCALKVANITRPERYFLIAAKGDEVLDWREMVKMYSDAKQKIIEGGDHAFSGFDGVINEVMGFAD